MILLIIISIIVLFLSGLLVLPARLVLNTEKNNYFFDIPIYVRVQLVPENQLFFIRMRLFFISFKLWPAHKKKTNNVSKAKSSKRKIKQKKKRKPGITSIIDMLKNFFAAITVKKARADIDTGDYPLNAQLIPVTYMINNDKVNVGINFENRNYFDIEIYTRLYKITWIVIKNFMLNK